MPRDPAQFPQPRLIGQRVGKTQKPLGLASQIPKAKVAPPLRSKSLVGYGGRSSRVLNLVIAIPVTEAQDLTETLDHLGSEVPVEVANRVELLVTADTGYGNLEALRKQVSRFSRVYGMRSTFWTGNTRGNILNHNRVLYGLINKIDATDLIVMPAGATPRGNVWAEYRRLHHQDAVGILGIGAPGDWSPGVMWLTKDIACALGYLDTEVTSVGAAWELYTRRAYRHLGLDFGSVRGIGSEFWGALPKSEPPSHLYTTLEKQYQQSRVQARADHGIPNPEKEWGGVNTILASKVSHHSREHYRVPIKVSSPKFTQTPYVVSKFPGTVVVLAIRGSHREAAMTKVLKSIQRQTVPVKIVVVEQDTEPRVKEWVEPLVDRYVFTWSSRAFNKSWAFNVGVRQYESDFVLLQDADIPIPEDYVEKSVERLGCRDALVPWKSIQYLDPKSSKDWPEAEKSVLYCHDSRSVHGGSVLVKRDFYLNIRGMDERFESWGGEDDCLYLKMTRLGNVLPFQAEHGFELVHLHHPPRDDAKRNEIATANNYKLLLDYWRTPVQKLVELSSSNFGNLHRGVG